MSAVDTALPKFRVWPDDTVQELPAEPYSWMSDDYREVHARDEVHAIAVANGKQVIG